MTKLDNYIEEKVEELGDEAVAYFTSLGLEISAEEYGKLTIWTDSEIRGILSGDIELTDWDRVELGMISESDEGGEEADLSREQLEAVRDARRKMLIPVVVEAMLGDLEGEGQTAKREKIAREFAGIGLAETDLLISAEGDVIDDARDQLTEAFEEDDEALISAVNFLIAEELPDGFSLPTLENLGFWDLFRLQGVVKQDPDKHGSLWAAIKPSAEMGGEDEDVDFFAFPPRAFDSCLYVLLRRAGGRPRRSPALRAQVTGIHHDLFLAALNEINERRNVDLRAEIGPVDHVGIIRVDRAAIQRANAQFSHDPSSQVGTRR